MQEFIKEEIRKIADKVSFLRNIFIAIVSGLLGIVFAFSQDKIVVNSLVIALFVTGILLILVITFRINNLERKRDGLILKLKDIN